MIKYILAALMILPIHAMEQPAIKVVCDKPPDASALIRTALNGYIDDHIMSLMERILARNRAGVLYPDLAEQRQMSLKIGPSNSPEARDLVIRYLIRELTDHNHKVTTRSRSHKRQKYVIALIGASATVISCLVATLCTYFLE